MLLFNISSIRAGIDILHAMFPLNQGYSIRTKIGPLRQLPFLQKSKKHHNTFDSTKTKNGYQPVGSVVKDIGAGGRGFNFPLEKSDIVSLSSCLCWDFN